MSLSSLLYNVQNLGSTVNVIKKMVGIKKGSSSPKVNTSNANDAIGELTLLFETLYNVLEKKGVFTQDEFKKEFDELDMSDGVKDGKLNR